MGMENFVVDDDIERNVHHILPQITVIEKEQFSAL
jgi:hypothetical protein